MSASRPGNKVPNAENSEWSPRASLDILEEGKKKSLALAGNQAMIPHMSSP
jgi:hypothetical protein